MEACSTSESRSLKRKHSDSSDSSSATPVQQCTSDWLESTLRGLHISSNIVNLKYAKDIISSFAEKFHPLLLHEDEISTTTLKTESLNILVDMCMEMLDIGSTPFDKLNVDDIKDVDYAFARNMIFESTESNGAVAQQGVKLKRKSKTWSPKPVKEVDENKAKIMEWVGEQFHVHGHRFSQQLINMCVECKKSGSLNEHMFGSLFQEFTGMCGFMCLTGQQQLGTTMIINGKEVSSKPDMVFPYYVEDKEQEMKILAVCEVKATYEPKDSGSPKGLERGVAKMKYERHLDDKLLGQNGGELLLHIPFTEKDCILGIIVQRTNVTFSYFMCDKQQLAGICSGQATTPLEIKYSQPYNYLKKQERAALMEVFLKLGLIQFLPCI